MFDYDQLDPKGRRIVDAVHERARTDRTFRTLAIRDPRKAVKELTGEDVPSSFRIAFVDADAYDFVSVLPPSDVSGELTEDELDVVAGGTGDSRDDETYGGSGG